MQPEATSFLTTFLAYNKTSRFVNCFSMENIDPHYPENAYSVSLNVSQATKLESIAIQIQYLLDHRFQICHWLKCGPGFLTEIYLFHLENIV